MPADQTILEYDRPDLATFRSEIYTAARPAVMRGLGADLEPVRIARRSAEEFKDYLKDHVGPKQVKVLSGKPDAGDTFFFEGDVSKVNFDRLEMPFTHFVDGVADKSAKGEMLFMEATAIGELSPALAQALQLPIAPGGVAPLAWLGNRTRVQTHFDHSQNIAYVVCGRRKFTLFPPEQTPNLYMAPFERSPSGAPISMVSIDDPDLGKYPRFAEAREHMIEVYLEPGDALFVPYMWWHHVQALEDFNMLVNYWWNEYDVMGSPYEAMLHAILTLRDLPPPMRDAWKAMFETFVFKDHGEPMEHIEPHLRGGMGPLDGRQRAELWHVLASSMSEYVQRMRGGG